jgi:hypothetical protein
VARVRIEQRQEVAEHCFHPRLGRHLPPPPQALALYDQRLAVIDEAIKLPVFKGAAEPSSMNEVRRRQAAAK